MLTCRSPLATHPSRPRLTGHASHIHGIVRGGRASSQLQRTQATGRASSQLQRTQATGRPFYGREFEKEQLDRELKQDPCEILLLLGPPNCGKSALLDDFCKGKRHVVYLDCCGMDSSGPDEFITGLLEQLQSMVPCNLRVSLCGLGRELLSKTVSKQGLSLNLMILARAQIGDLGQPYQPDACSTTLNQVFRILKEIFGAWKKEAQQDATGTYVYGPVLIIDEANKLMSWGDKHPERLRSLLDFFVQITKQKGLCHVVMATSEFGFQTWLNKAIGQGRWRPQVIGDFTESEARDFLFQQLGGVSSSDGKSIDKDDKAWAAVYEVCGGNAGALARLAKDIRKSPGCDWEEALRELWQVELDRVERLLLGGEGFAAVHYAAAALKLLDSQQARNTVGKRDMQELLGRYVEGTANKQSARVQAGAAVLERLVQADALSVRPPSSWARDIPVQAFGKKSLVTAPSTMDLYCMRLSRPELEQVLVEHDSAQ